MPLGSSPTARYSRRLVKLSLLSIVRLIGGIHLSIVLAENAASEQLHIFSDLEGASGLNVEEIIRACHATCSLPSLFAMDGDQARTSADSATYTAVGPNKMNPAREVISEARRLFPGRKIGILVSIGCGAPSAIASERENTKLGPALREMTAIYQAAEHRARLMGAEQELLDWTNYFRFTAGQALEAVGVDESFASSRIQHLVAAYRGDHAQEFERCADSLERHTGEGWLKVIKALEASLKAGRAALRLDTDAVKRTVKRYDNTHPTAPEFFDEANYEFSSLAYRTALNVEEETKRILGPSSDRLWRAVESTEWLLESYRSRGLVWVGGPDPVRHSTLRFPPKPHYSTLKQLVNRLVPCHLSSVEDATEVLNTSFDFVFASRERTEWIWDVAVRSDAEVRAELWLEGVDARLLQTSSDVLQLLRKNLRRRFSRGPWFGSLSLGADQTHSREVDDAAPTVNTVPQRTDEEVSVVLKDIREEYSRPLLSPRAPRSYAQGTVTSSTGTGNDLGVSDMSVRLASTTLAQAQPTYNTQVSSGRPAYQYEKLPGANFTRVISLHPAKKIDDPLVCDIFFLDLNCEPYSYDAVSYVWGEPKFPEVLGCGQHVLNITTSLAGALRRFRSQSATRRLWVDAVCINQNDNQEKALQVQAMSLIYQRARCCVVYLGEKGPGQEDYMYFLIRLAERVENFANATVSTDKNNKQIEEAMIEVFGARNDRAVEEISRIPWFGRRWVIQEASLCSAVVVFFGRSMASFNLLATSLAAIQNSSFVSTRVLQGALENVQAIAFVRTQRKQWLGAERHGILDLLVECHSSDCSEPRDRVFAFLSFAPDVASLAVRAYYGDFLVETYADFAVQHMRSSSTLDVLHCAGAFKRDYPPIPVSPHFGPDELMGFPSFVPDWSAPRRYAPLMGISRFTAGLTLDVPKRSLERRRLVLPGVVLDKIQVRSNGFAAPLLPGHFSAIMKATMSCYDEYMSLGSRNKEKTPWEKIFRAVTADGALHGSLWIRKGGRQRSADELGNYYQRAENTRLALWEGFAAHFEDEPEAQDYEHFSKSISEGDFLQMQAAKTLAETMAGRAFFVSEKGYMGIGPWDIEAGDVVVVLLGVRTPFVLRPNADAGPGSYSIIGDCYVDGFMNGQALRISGIRMTNFLIV